MRQFEFYSLRVKTYSNSTFLLGTGSAARPLLPMVSLVEEPTTARSAPLGSVPLGAILVRDSQSSNWLIRPVDSRCRELR